jgi:hypothetical protein
MAQYRIFLLDRSNDVIGGRTAEFQNDKSACAGAKTLRGPDQVTEVIAIDHGSGRVVDC